MSEVAGVLTITVNMVEAAYESSGLRPVRGAHFVAGSPCLVDALAVLWITRQGADDTLRGSDYEVRRWSEQWWGRSYVAGFLAGWDGPAYREEPGVCDSEWWRGRIDGHEIAKVVFKEPKVPQ